MAVLGPSGGATAANCPLAYLQKLADFLPTSWGDPKAATVVADEIRALGSFDPAKAFAP